MTQVRTALPPITLTATDFERLERLAAAAAKTFPHTAHFLAREIERANVVEASAPGVVGMGSTVAYRDDTTMRTRTITLVFPDEADLATGKISVLSPVGAALIGLSAGQTIEWRTPAGGLRSLTVLRVGGVAKADAAGGAVNGSAAVANPARP